MTANRGKKLYRVGGARRKTICVVLMSFVVCGCYKPLQVSVPEMPSGNRKWSLEIRCASQGCVEKNDVLVGEGIEIEIEPYNRGWAGIRPFVVSLRFRMPENIQLLLEPSQVCLMSAVESQSCARAARNVAFHASIPMPFVTGDYISGPVVLPDMNVLNPNKRRSVDLLFDLPTPGVENQFSLTIGGLFREGHRIEVPTIIFNKGER